MKKRFKKILSLAISVFIVSQTVFVIPLSAESNQEKSYIYHFNDYETLLDEDGWLQKTTSDVVLTAETESPLSGERSLKASSDGTTPSGYVGFALSDLQIPVGKSVRVCFDYKVVYGKAQYGGVGFIGYANDMYNFTHIIDNTYTVAKAAFSEGSVMDESKTFTCTLKRNDFGNLPPVGITWYDGKQASSVLFDNLTVAEIIENVSAASADETKGSVSVVNKNGYENFAVNETAIFTATPAGGNIFTGWYDEDNNLVSDSAVFETTVTTDISLTAKFETANNAVEISFDSNGGSGIDPISGSAGSVINMPTAPAKDGYSFAGWYTDEGLSQKFPCKTFPNSDTTLYAKWIKGIYQDFEDFTVSTNNPFNSSIIEDSSQTFGGSSALKIAGSTNTITRVNLAQSTTDRLYNYATTGEQVTISFKYKLVSGKVSFYARTSTVPNNVHALPSYNDTNGVSYANAFVYLNKDLNSTSNDWQTASVTYNTISQAELDKTGLTIEQVFLYTQLFFTVKSDDTEIYIDDVMIYKSVDIPINYSSETVRLESTANDVPLTAAFADGSVSFRAVCDPSVTPTVVYNDNEIVPIDGVYTIDNVNKDSVINVTASGMSTAQNHAPGVGLNGEDLTTYNADVFTKNIWEGDTVYHEAVMFANTSDGIDQTVKTLLYPIDDVISIRNDDLDTWYIKGVDYKIENGRLVWLEGGQMPIWTGPFTVPQTAADEYYDPALAEHGDLSTAGYYTTDDKNGLYLIYDAYHEDHTVYVTYKHSKTWEEYDGSSGYTPKAPENQSYDMKNFYDKLSTSEDVDVLVYGASSATGCSSTGANMNYDLFNADGEVVSGRSSGTGIKAPTFFEQATAELVKRYGNNNSINYYNIALGGKDAAWGAQNLQSRITAMNNYYGKTINPDIIYLKFAGNNARTSPESYKNSISSIVSQLHDLYADAVIILVSGKLNNERTYIYGDYHNNMLDLEQVLSDIADSTSNCIVAKTTSVWAEIVKSKDFEDYLSNNINHANDFWAKVTAQIIIASAEKAENVTAVKTAYNNAAAIKHANYSSTNKNGLRIYNEIKTEWIDAAGIVEYGSVAIRTARLNGGELTVDTGKKGVAYSDGTYSAEKAAVLFESKDGAYVFTSYLTNIPELYYGEIYSVRAYAIDKTGKIYYGDIIEISVFKIANAIDNGNSVDGSQPSDADKEAFYAFISDSNYLDYKQWCTSNNLNTGRLYDEKYNF